VFPKLNTNILQITIFFVFFLYLVLNVFLGLDLTDEMQYYGQVKGLLDTNRLFSNDLFIQQTIYLLFFPLFKIHEYFFLDKGLVIFSRFIVFIISLSVTFYAYLQFNKLSNKTIVNLFAALSLCLSIFFTGNFSLNYNSASQILWILFLLNFLNWEEKNIVFFLFLFFLMLFINPLMALSIASILFIRYIFEKNLKEILFIISSFFLIFICYVFLLIKFSSPEILWTSIAFSQGFNIGSIIEWKGIDFFLLFLIMFSFVIYFNKYLNFRLSNYYKSFYYLFFLATYLLATFFLTINSNYLILIFCITFLYLTVSNIKVNESVIEKNKFKWQIFSIFIFFLSAILFSSNGVKQGLSSLLIALPLLIIYSNQLLFFKLMKKNIKVSPIFFIFIIFFLNNFLYSYRDNNIMYQSEEVDFIPAFYQIRVSPARYNFLKKTSESFEDLKNKETLIVSRFPVIYFSGFAKYETCMIFMHSIESSSSEERLSQCLNSKKPEKIILVKEDSFPSDKNHRRINLLLEDYIEENLYLCDQNEIKFHNHNNFNPSYLNYLNCSFHQ
tara:strand:- start:1510 stop:3174 length:1665 start_codon:yes stop_codon:yes gene_type:complete